MKKPILAAILGGLAVFVWGMISHMLLPLGQAGVSAIKPDSEPQVLAVMRATMPQRAIYVFPGLDMSKSPTPEEQKLWQARFTAGPAGIVVINPKPTGNFMTWLGTELATNILAALMVALVMLHIPDDLGVLRRGGLVALLGLFETLDIDASQWNWYNFPTAYLTAQAVDHTIGWFLGGLVIAWMCRESVETFTPRPSPRPPVRAR